MHLHVNPAVFCLLSSLVFGVSLGVSAAEGGGIRGTVNYCDQGGVLGMKITLSGHQASILTSTDGKFYFEAVPAGKYALFYNLGDRMVHVSESIEVQTGAITQLGEIDFCTTSPADIVNRELHTITDNHCESQPGDPGCMDYDKDGVIAAQDCDDHNDRIKPGALELCDGIDNNCNGEVDEQGALAVANGKGICRNGKIVVKSCERGFADCDGQGDNGCETDLMSDNDNCGACGNECPSLEICVLGMC